MAMATIYILVGFFADYLNRVVRFDPFVRFAWPALVLLALNALAVLTVWLRLMDARAVLGKIWLICVFGPTFYWVVLAVLSTVVPEWLPRSILSPFGSLALGAFYVQCVVVYIGLPLCLFMPSRADATCLRAGLSPSGRSSKSSG